MTELFANLGLGLVVASSLSNLMYCLIGTVLGTVIGILPGVGPLVTISVLLPMTYGLEPVGALIMLAGIYYGAAYGGSTTAILVNLPGESSSAITCIDGYQMAKRGRAGAALTVAALGSLFAGTVCTLLIALAGPPLGRVALSFGAPEYFSLILVALIASAAIVQGGILNGAIMATAGVVVGLVGIDVNSGVYRFTFGYPGLADGVDFAIVAMGIFAFPEIINSLSRPEARAIVTGRVGSLRPNAEEARRSVMPVLRGTALGAFFGVLPGGGLTISSFASYMLEKRVSRQPQEFGHGAVEGVAGPEAANNAAAQTAFIPTLTLGVPGSPTMALILGALMIHGITPGPQVISQNPQLFWGLIVSMWIGNLFLVGLNLPLIPLWVKALAVPYRWLYPLIMTFACMGVMSLSNSATDVMLAAIFCVIGFAMLKLGMEPAPFILGLVLGPLLEENFRRAMRISRGDPMIFLDHKISAAFLAAAAAILLLLVVSPLWARWRRRLA